MAAITRRLLSEQELKAELAGLPGWRYEGARLVKTFAFPKYMDGVRFADRVAEVAEELNHHPDMWIRFRRVTLELSTHSAGGVTQLDVVLARRADELAAGLMAPAAGEAAGSGGGQPVLQGPRPADETGLHGQGSQRLGGTDG